MTRRPWTAADDAHLRKFHAEGKDDPTIAYILGRHRELILQHRKKLGLPANPRRFYNLGRVQTPEAKAKTGEASRLRWQDPEYRARMMPHLARATAAASEARVKAPQRGTAEFRTYRKIRDTLGPSEAHKLLMPPASP
jgi:hypothetical protein